MSTTLDIERALADWMSDGPATMPNGVIANVAGRIAAQPQKTSWRAAPTFRAWSSMRFAAVAAVAAAFLAVAVGTFVVLPRLPGVGVDETPTPTASADAPSAAPSLQTTPRPTLAPSAEFTPPVVHPPACSPDDSVSKTTSPAAEPDIASEALIWTADDGTPQVLVVLTNNRSEPWELPGAVLTLFDACGNRSQLRTPAGDALEPGQDAVVLRSFTRFVPVRVEVSPVTNAAAALPNGGFERCGEPSMASRDGVLVTTSQFSMDSGILLDFEIEAVAAYRDADGGLVGAAKTVFEHLHRTSTAPLTVTPFVIELSGNAENLASVATYCRIRRNLGFSP